MSAAVKSIESFTPPVGAALVGWPWWAVAITLAASCGPTWVMGWLDVFDRVRTRASRHVGDDDAPPNERSTRRDDGRR